MLFAPLLAWRHVEVTERRTACDFALVIKMLVDRCYPDAEKIVLVLDNLNTHTAASLYEAFAPHEAKRLADKIEWHYTPKHGSWLDMAEIELGVLARQCSGPPYSRCRAAQDAKCLPGNRRATTPTKRSTGTLPPPMHG